MLPLPALIALLDTAILLTEGIMWWSFHTHVRGIQFPREADASHLRFMTLPRLRLLTILHTVTIVVMSNTLLITLW